MQREQVPSRVFVGGQGLRQEMGYMALTLYERKDSMLPANYYRPGHRPDVHYSPRYAKTSSATTKEASVDKETDEDRKTIELKETTARREAREVQLAADAAAIARRRGREASRLARERDPIPRTRTSDEDSVKRLYDAWR